MSPHDLSRHDLHRDSTLNQRAVNHEPHLCPGMVESGQAAYNEHLVKTAVRLEPHGMRSPILFCLPVVMAACSSGSNEQAASARDASKAREPAAIKSARRACKRLRIPSEEHEKFDVGISDYEACLGERANLTHPANPQLCHLAKSTMSATGICILGE